MKKENIVTRKWGDRRKGKTDWARVDALTDELQGFGDPATGVRQDVAKGSDLALLLIGRGQEFPPLRVGQVKPLSSRSEQFSRHLFIIDCVGAPRKADRL